MDLSKLVKSVIEKEIELSSLTSEERTAVVETLTLMKNHLGNGDMLDKKEQLELAKNGQWSFKKAIKPGPPMDYSKINPKQNPNTSPAATKQAFTDTQTAHDQNASTMNYKDNTTIAPTWAGAKQKKLETDAKIDAETKRTALEEIAARQKSPATLKQSEAEPHSDDSRHEAKEQAKAEKIKEGAQDILDMHKKESNSVFQMSHAHDVEKMPHSEGKAMLHGVLQASSATPENKAKIAANINGTKNSRQLSNMVAQHILAAGDGSRKSLRVLR